MTRKLLICIIFLTKSYFTFSQTSYRNEWIDYNKTYYKFHIGIFGYDDAVNFISNKGVVRISQTVLAASGLGSVPAEQFQLWRNGQEVPVYISKSSGVLGSSDYIEFWGRSNDGKLDTDLYSDSSFQLSDYWSLQTDSSTYFITVNTAGNNKRLQAVANNVAQASIQADKNFMCKVGRYFRAEITGGYAVVSDNNFYLHSSAYDRGEGWVSRRVMPIWALPQGFNNLYADTAGPALTVHMNTVGNALNARFVQLYLNGDSLTSYRMDYFNSAKIVLPGLTANKIKNDAAVFVVGSTSINDYDELRVSSIEMDYPRVFNFGAKTSFEFNLAASDTGRYIKITNFNYGTSVPVLYDLANGKRYTADMSVADTLRFLLLPSAQPYQLVLVRSDGSAAASFTGTLQPRKFTDFSQTNNQGNYLIISNPLIYGSDTSNFVEQYRAYRKSAAGGGFNAKLVDINDLTDQFAYGIKQHPLSVKNFLRYARNKFTISPSYVFIIGKGITYDGYIQNETDPLADELNLVPTWGSPGSDNFLSSVDNKYPIPLIPIGRLSAVSTKEVGDYLAKIKTYETTQQDSSATINNKGWMKNVLQLAGANDPKIGPKIDTFTQKYKRIISDTLFGGNVTNFSKFSNPSGYAQDVINFKNIFEKGSGLLEYFGHSSSTNLDFSLDNPANYNNAGKYPVFIVNGCLAGNIFDFDVNRLNARSTISERFVLQPGKGAIGYLSTSSYGVLNYLDIYTTKFYESITGSQYGKGFGDIMKDALAKALDVTGSIDFYGKIHAEQYTFHGDPALKLSSSAKPDYAIDAGQIQSSPAFISIADDSFTAKIFIYNIGKATDDSVHFSAFRKYPGGDSVLIFSKEFSTLRTLDSVIVKLPIVPNRDKNGIRLSAFIDDDNKVAEVSESNNFATKTFAISDVDVRPVYPYNYAIVTSNRVNLSASTSNPLDSLKQYIIEFDTTALFNSSSKITKNISSVGGLLQVQNISLALDNTVYYWRVAATGANPYWSVFSFTHNSNGNQGFEQAHFYQHTQSTLNGISLDSVTRKFSFGKTLTNLFVLHSIYPTSGVEDNEFSVSVNGNFVTESACIGSSIIFNVFDTLTLSAYYPDSTGPGSDCKASVSYNFEYSTQDPASRKAAMDFLDKIPDGVFVVARRIYDLGNEDWAPTVWAADTAMYGAGNSLYHRFKAQGLQIDSFTYPRTFFFVYKKNDSTHFTPVSVFSEGLYDRISLSQNIPTFTNSGFVTSPAFGPAKGWNKIKWNGYSQDSTDKVSVDIIGENYNKADSVLYTLDSTTHELNISGVSVAQYPFVKLRMFNQDSLHSMPYQLQQWSVEYQPVAEGAIAPNLGMKIPDSVLLNHDVNITYDSLNGFVVFKNVSNSNFLPLKLKFILYDTTNAAHEFVLPKTRALPAGDTLHVSFNIDVRALQEGTYNLYLMVNADKDQPEQFLFNNFVYKYIYINRHATVLPVHLVDFSAKPSAKTVLLKWVVTNEINFSHYEVEYSTDGRSFKNIGNVNAVNNNGAGNQSYSLVHFDPVNGKNYYRLKMVDKDGAFSYSQVLLVNFNGEAGVSVYPNPFASRLNVSVAGINNVSSKVCVYNSGGQLVLQKNFAGYISLDLTKLASGNYLVQVDDGSKVQSFKVQKQR